MGRGEERKKEGGEMLMNLLASIISSVLCKSAIYLYLYLYLYVHVCIVFSMVHSCWHL